jgi:hypothetical protein
MKTVAEGQSVSRGLPGPVDAFPGTESPETDHQVQEQLDRVGATASLLCAVHCAVLPLVVTLLPLVGLSFLADERVEWMLVGLSAALGITSLCLGYREHRSRRALGVLGIGLALLALGRILEGQHIEPWGVPIVVAGGLTMAGAHLLNRRLCHDCRECHRDADNC